MTEIFELSPTDASNTSVTGESLDGNVANMGRMDNTLQAILGMFGRWTSSDTVASAGTTDIGAQAETYLTISGTTTITAFGTVRAGTIRFLRFSGALTLTHNATSLILPGAANITTVAGDTAVFVSEGSGNWRCLGYQRSTGTPVSPVTKGHLHGLTLSNNSTDPTNDIDIAAGEAASADTDPVLMKLSSALTKQLDAAWAVGNNQGGLDTGTVGNNTYFVFLIRRPDTGVVDVLFSLNTGVPNLPTNYTQYRRIGSIIRTGGAITGFVQDGDIFMRKVPVNDISATNPGTSAVTAALSIPVGLRVEAIISAGIATSTTSTDFALLVSDLSTTDTAPTVTLADVAFSSLSTAGTYRTFTSKRVFSNSGAQIRYRISTSDASTTVRINTFGWVDNRGRLA